MNLGNVHIILVEPKVPGNIGSAARGMKTMGMENLILVNPAEYKTPEARWMAYGAEEILDRAKVFSTVQEAISKMKSIVGTTRRTGRKRQPTYHLREFSEKIAPITMENEAAILFGREDKGLTNEELELCDIIVKIPEETEYPSLNLAQAVTVVCYELFIASQAGQAEGFLKLAEPEDIREMYGHIEQILVRIGYERGQKRRLPETIIKSLRRIFGRAGLEQRDVNTIRGVCRQLEKYLDGLGR